MQRFCANIVAIKDRVSSSTILLLVARGGAMSGTEGIAAVAERIRDRAHQLASERAVLELVQAEQDQQQSILDEEIDKCAKVRRAYLTSVRSRHGVELELCSKMEDQKTECMESIEKMQQESKDILAHKQELQANWEELLREVLSVHSLHKEVYRRSIQASIEDREKHTLKRSRQLSTLSQHIDTFHKNKENMEAEKKKLVEEAGRLAKSEHREEEEISKLDAQVRDSLTKVRLVLTVHLPHKSTSYRIQV